MSSPPLTWPDSGQQLLLLRPSPGNDIRGQGTRVLESCPWLVHSYHKHFTVSMGEADR